MPVSRKRKKVKNKIKVKQYYKFNPTDMFVPNSKGLELADDIASYLNSDGNIDNLPDNKFIPILKGEMFKDIDINNKQSVLISEPFIILTSLLKMKFVSEGDINDRN